MIVIAIIKKGGDNMLKVDFKGKDETRLAIAKTGMSLRQFSLSIGIS